MKKSLINIIIILTLITAVGYAQDEESKKSTHVINIPEHLSPEMKKVFENWTPYWEMEDFEGLPAPDDYEGWKKNDEAKRVVALKVGKAILKEFGASAEEKKFGGVRVLDIKPKNWTNKDKVLIHTHGGGFYAHSPETALILSVPLADNLNIRVI